MKSYREILRDAEEKKIAIGHFNISTIDALWGIFDAAKERNVPVLIGASEGERDFIGISEVVSLVKNIRGEHDYPIYLNADHTYSLERVKEAVDAGFDSVIFDGAKLPIEENIRITRECVEYAKSVDHNILVEAELGYIGSSSKMLDAVPEGASLGDMITTVDEAIHFVKETGVDLFAPAVGNIHGMLKGMPDPALNIERVREIKEAVGIPLVLHGASGNSDDDIRAAIKAGIRIVHINTEIRVAWKKGVEEHLQAKPDDVAPYAILKDAKAHVKEVVGHKLDLFANL
ncbi:MAG TPA: class II fructose-bisphosphate aldolase [Candidatus Paceibacterota bacterium]